MLGTLIACMLLLMELCSWFVSTHEPARLLAVGLILCLAQFMCPQALGGLGSIYTSLKQYSKAATYHQQEVTESRVLGNGFIEARALDNLGLAFR